MKNIMILFVLILLQTQNVYSADSEDYNPDLRQMSAFKTKQCSIDQVVLQQKQMEQSEKRRWIRSWIRAGLATGAGLVIGYGAITVSDDFVTAFSLAAAATMAAGAVLRQTLDE